MPARFLKSRIVFDMCTMAVDCSHGAISLVSRSQTVRIFQLLLNLESRSRPVSSFAAVAMNVLQVSREVNFDHNIYMGASEQERNAMGRAEFTRVWATPIGDIRATSLREGKVLLVGEILEYSISTISVTCVCNQSFDRSACQKMVYDDFQRQHGHLGDSVSGLKISNNGNEYECRGQIRVPQPRECRLVLNLVEPGAPAAQPGVEEGEDGEENNDAVESLDEDDDDLSIHLKRCDWCNSIGHEGTKCEDGSECDSENGGWYVNDIGSDDDGGDDGNFSDDSDDSSQLQMGRCGVCGATGPQGLKCEFGEDCNEDTGGYFSERL